MRRDGVLKAVRRAAEVLEEFSIRARIKEGYTRVDPAQLACAADVTVMFRPLDKLLGGFLRESDQAGIIVNILRPRGLVHMTCAHELGHFFLGHESTTDETVNIGTNSDPIEQQANQFAYSILAPRWLVVANMNLKGWTKSHLGDPSIVYQLSLRLGMSFEAMVWSLARLQFVSQSSAQQILANKPKALKLNALKNQDEFSRVPGDVWVLDIHDKDRIIEPAPTDRFVVDLPNHASAGHLWTVDELRCEGFTLEPFVQEARTVTRKDRSSIVVGGRGSDTLRYELVPVVDADGSGAGEAHRRTLIAMHETAPWSSSSESYEALSFSAEVDDLNEGLSRYERIQRLQRVRGLG